VERLVTLEAAGVSLGGAQVLRDVDITLDAGQVLGVSGPNGAGKTTLLRLMATLIGPSAGTGQVLGAGLGSNEAYLVRPRIGLISHRPAVIPELSIGENLDHAVRLAGLERARVNNALRVVGLDESAETPGRAASFGMLRRLELARLLITGPRLLLLDEPYSGLDIDAVELIGAIVDRTIESGGAVVMVSHDAGQLAGHTDVLHSLASGRLEARP
jgi:heme exporter protein A